MSRFGPPLHLPPQSTLRLPANFVALNHHLLVLILERQFTSISIRRANHFTFKTHHHATVCSWLHLRFVFACDAGALKTRMLCNKGLKRNWVSCKNWHCESRSVTGLVAEIIDQVATVSARLGFTYPGLCWPHPQLVKPLSWPPSLPAAAAAQEAALLQLIMDSQTTNYLAVLNTSLLSKRRLNTFGKVDSASGASSMSGIDVSFGGLFSLACRNVDRITPSVVPDTSGKLTVSTLTPADIIRSPFLNGCYSLAPAIEKQLGANAIDHAVLEGWYLFVLGQYAVLYSGNYHLAQGPANFGSDSRRSCYGVSCFSRITGKLYLLVRLPNRITAVFGGRVLLNIKNLAYHTSNETATTTIQLTTVSQSLPTNRRARGNRVPWYLQTGEVNEYRALRPARSSRPIQLLRGGRAESYVELLGRAYQSISTHPPRAHAMPPACPLRSIPGYFKLARRVLRMWMLRSLWRRADNASAARICHEYYVQLESGAEALRFMIQGKPGWRLVEHEPRARGTQGHTGADGALRTTSGPDELTDNQKLSEGCWTVGLNALINPGRIMIKSLRRGALTRQSSSRNQLQQGDGPGLQVMNLIRACNTCEIRKQSRNLKAPSTGNYTGYICTHGSIT
ncbi:hypothetical protein FB45DRAFT_1075491 [Roridomyces roridus]|uniref:Uncharacterized protein n=1 Tax=Roridomyces roridus TaxID=1738132 RepID=A0AAD7CI29_9AGAR|nr:hypothetical protein FB45DRAFT_1075491 [Roridomyces roridus]